MIRIRNLEDTERLLILVVCVSLLPTEDRAMPNFIINIDVTVTSVHLLSLRMSLRQTVVEFS